MENLKHSGPAHHVSFTSLITLMVWATVAWAEPGPDDIIELSRKMVALQRAGNHGEALTVGQLTLELSEQTLGPEHPTVAIYLDHLGTLHRTLGEGAKAEPLFLRALAIREKTLGPEHPALASSLTHLATLYRDERRYAEAEPLFQRAVALREKQEGTTNPSLAKLLERYAELLQATNRAGEAARLRTRAAAIGRQ